MNRENILKQSDKALIILEFVLSVVFILFGYYINNIYFRGVGVGLLIAWVTGAIVLLYKKAK